MQKAGAATAAAVALLFGLTGAGAASSYRGLETITVSNTNSKPVQSTTALVPAHAYRLTVSGTVSDWCPGNATKASDCSFGSPLSIGQGVDALYCYAAWRCPEPQLWRQLQILGHGLDELARQAGKIPYSPTHRYAAVIHDWGSATGHFDLVAYDAVGSGSDNSGAFTVEIEDLGPNEPPEDVCRTRPGSPGCPYVWILEARGTVKAGPPGGPLAPVAAGARLPLGSEIRTYWDGEVHLLRAAPVGNPNAPKYYIAPLSDLIVRKDGTSFVRNGRVVFYGTDVVYTPTVVTADLGTVYAVDVDAGGASIVSVTRGVVRVTPLNTGLAPVTVSVGREVLVTRTTESKVSAIGFAGASPGAISRNRARKLVERVLNGARGRCRVTVAAVTLTPTAGGWNVSAKVSGGRRGWATWAVVGTRLTAANVLAKQIAAGCR